MDDDGDSEGVDDGNSDGWMLGSLETVTKVHWPFASSHDLIVVGPDPLS